MRRDTTWDARLKAAGWTLADYNQWRDPKTGRKRRADDAIAVIEYRETQALKQFRESIAEETK